MKKLVVTLSVIATAVLAQASVEWSLWLDNPEAKADLSFGVANHISKVETFELSLLYSASPVESGLQWSFLGINDSDSDCALQLSWWFNRGKNPCVQLGCVNFNKQSVFDLGFVNFSDATKVQIGFLNFNKNGFLPVFPFVNLDKSLFE